MNKPIFLDANIFMYAVGSEHVYKAPCLRILSDVEEGKLTAVINTEIIQEMLYRYSHINLPDKGIQICQTILEYPINILPVTVTDAKQAIKLFSTYHSSGIKSRDVIHVATMQNNRITHLISADKEFDRLPSVTRIDPLAYSTQNTF